MDVDGLTTWVSSRDMEATLQRVRAAIAAQGMTIFAEIDHAAGAAAAGLRLAPMRVLIFGDATAETPLMRAAPTVGIDLPLKVLVWNDEEGGTWIAYNDPGWIAARHSARAGNVRVLAGMREVLAALADEVTRLDTQPPDPEAG